MQGKGSCGCPGAGCDPGRSRTHGTCGTPLTFRIDAQPTIDITVATLDDPGALMPERETRLSHRVAWAAVDPDRPGFPKGRT